jgi:hypothetical protein
MIISNQNNDFNINKTKYQFVVNPKTGEKELPITILLNGLDKNKQKSKSAFMLSEAKRFDILEINSDIKNIFLNTIDEKLLNPDCGEWNWETDEKGYVKWLFSKGDVGTNLRLQQRADFNERINDILNKNGIELSRDDKFTFEIDFYKNIRVLGQNAAKAKAIERVLNDNNLGLELSGHVQSSIIGNQEKYLGEHYKTFNAAAIVTRKYLGTELENLILKDNKIYTPDGILLADALRNSEIVNKMRSDCSTNASHAVDCAIEYITKALKLGNDKIINFPPIRINFQEGGLLDVYELEYGFGKGQTWWMEKYNTKYFNREEIIEHHNKMREYAISSFER